MPARRRARGFTLIELMVSLAVLAILAGLAAPSVAEMVGRQRLRTATSDVVNSLIRARSTAIKMQRNVIMQPASAGTAWAGGWNIVHPVATTTNLYSQNALKAVTITGPTSVTYRFSGRTGTSPTWQISANGTSDVRCVSLGLNGLPIQKRVACS